MLVLPLLVSLLFPSMKDAAPAHRAEIEKWRNNRVRNLTADDGWLTVIALSWLEEGDNAVGSAPSNRIVLPPGKAPAKLGTIRLTKGQARLTVAPGVAVTSDGKPVWRFRDGKYANPVVADEKRMYITGQSHQYAFAPRGSEGAREDAQADRAARQKERDKNKKQRQNKRRKREDKRQS